MYIYIYICIYGRVRRRGDAGRHELRPPDQQGRAGGSRDVCIDMYRCLYIYMDMSMLICIQMYIFGSRDVYISI